LIVCLIGVWLLRRHQPAPEVQAPKSQPAPAVQVETAPSEIAPVPETSEPQVEPAKPVALKSKIQKLAQNQPSQQPPKEPLHDPRAREALALVGLNQQAEQYWLQAIFDTSLPEKEREDLMEDLNEVGFTDPDNVTPDDLPLIVSRLQIIEQIEPNADPFMKEHLDEAYKDLAHMYAEVTGP
jgi:hypothetical protein